MKRPGLLLLLLLFVPAAYVLGLLLRSTSTELSWEQPVRVLGTSTPVAVRAVNPHGVRDFTAILRQGGKQYIVFQRSEPAKRWAWLRRSEMPRSYQFEAGSRLAPGVTDGKAELVVEAVSNDFLARRSQLVQAVEIQTKPPSLLVDDMQVVVTQGGTGAVAFSVSGYWTEAGVRLGPHEFRSFQNPTAKDASRRITLFAVPHDLGAGEKPIVFARNPTGAQVLAPVPHQLIRKRFRSREFNLSSSFLNKVVSELDPRGTGDLLQRFRRINQEMRQANNRTLYELRSKTADRPLFQGPFLPLAKSAPQAQFCDYRKYKYQGQVIDEQVHLGFDLASTQQAEVPAGNHGQVIFAGWLGIYGNAIVLDHGLGVQSLYAHLSQIQVKVGDLVNRGQIIGRSGSSGLAGGDHLHFGVQVDGVAVNPLEWWDPAWLEKRILSRYR
ncbi:MAG: M23 family metallopeptidase [Bryobacteraceae bacterium]|nr:M23 family metallopeptidase [Bryobacteraceae bacterium]MDW8377147.1 M23 family metallopeptidase [Bryobacterales bacterium]